MPIDTNRILVVDDEETIRHILVTIFEEKGCEIRAAESAESGLLLLNDFKPAVALVDIVLPGMNGIQLLSEIKKRSKDTEVLVMTSHATAETALEAMRRGAYDYLQKPFEDLEEVWIRVNRALEKRSLTLKNRALLEQQQQRNNEFSSEVPFGDADSTMDDFSSYSELLDFFIEMVVKKLDVDKASLMLLNRGTGELRVAACRGFGSVDVNRIRQKLGEGVSGSVAKTGEPILMTNDHADRSPDGIDPSDSHGPSMNAPIAMSVPLKSGEKVLGVINVTHRRSGKPFDSTDLTHLTNLAAQLAGTVEEARHSERLRKTYESLRATQNQLVFSERVTALGQMAAGVAHDFNNALSVILARTQLVLMNLKNGRPDVGKIQSDLDMIMKSSLQGAETIKRIQDYTKSRKDVEKVPVNLKAVIKDAVEIARPKWKDECEAQGRPIDIQFDLEDVPPVSGNLYELTQVVGNLIFNAVEAMPEGGLLTFKTHSEKDSVIFQVMDTGTGMDEETQKKVFEPFFTTKETGQGLGTSIIFRIISRHQGEIKVDSKLGEGTTFTVRLPRFVPDPEAAEGPGDDTVESFVPARVLLVDDDELVRETYAEALKISGHQVVAVPNGNRALGMFGKQKFDLVITDLSMSGISGFEVARKIKQLNSSVPIILLSGWMIQQDDPKVQKAGIDYVLVKPCLIEKLLSVVQKTVRTPAPV